MVTVVDSDLPDQSTGVIDGAWLTAGRWARGLLGAACAAWILFVAAVPAVAQASATPGSQRPVLEDPTGLPRREDPTGLSPRPAGEKAAAFTYFANRDLSADPYRRDEAVTQARCELACRRDTGCAAYSFDRWNRACFLKRQTGELLINARSISAVMRGNARPVDSSLSTYFEYFNGKAFAPTGYVGKPASDRNQCESLCATDDTCIAFTLVVSRNECRLYEQGSEYFSAAGSMSGAKRQ